MKLGAFLPSFTDFPPPERRELLVRFAKAAEDLGFSSLWAEDHILRINTNPAYSGLAWLDPIATLSYIASHTSLPLGLVYCGCLRNPVTSAKQLSTLMYLAPSGVTVVPVIGAWDREHEVAGIPPRQRGVRTDEWLDVVELLLSTPNASYKGRFCQFEEVTIDPIPDKPLRIWPSGGAAWYVEGVGPDEPSLTEPVIQRILRFGAWCVSSTASPAKAAADRERINKYAADHGMAEPDLYVSHTNFIHVVPTADRQTAYEIQAPLWNTRRTLDQTFEYMSERVYLNGSIDDIVRKLELRATSYGLKEMIALAHPGHEEQQLENWAKYLLPEIHGF